jgi:hypothetical protein
MHTLVHVNPGMDVAQAGKKGEKKKKKKRIRGLA